MWWLLVVLALSVCLFIVFPFDGYIFTSSGGTRSFNVFNIFGLKDLIHSHKWIFLLLLVVVICHLLLKKKPPWRKTCTCYWKNLLVGGRKIVSLLLEKPPCRKENFVSCCWKNLLVGRKICLLFCDSYFDFFLSWVLYITTAWRLRPTGDSVGGSIFTLCCCRNFTPCYCRGRKFMLWVVWKNLIVGEEN